MKGRQRAAFTLLELVIYMALLVLAVMAVGGLFTLGRAAQQSSLSSYLVSGQADTALRWLRRDLQETALVSLRCYPNPAASTQPPGCSFVSARDTSDKDTRLNVSPYGAPLWTKTIFYSLVVAPGARSGDLVRWESAIANPTYLPDANLSQMPNSFSKSDKTYRVILQNVLAPNTKVANLGGSPNFQSDSFGGFRVEFVQRAGGEDGPESLTAVNPSTAGQPQSSGNNTALVDVQLELLSADNYQPTFYELEFRAHPRY